MIRDNPSPGNYEELGDLLMDDGRIPQAREAFDKPSPPVPILRTPFYRRADCAIQMGDFAAALPDLERVVAKESDYDFQRAAGLLAHAYANTGQKEKAEALFRRVTTTSTLSETYLNFAELLASEQRAGEAREWAQKILDKKTNDAELPAAAGTAVVSSSERPPEAPARAVDLDIHRMALTPRLTISVVAP